MNTTRWSPFVLICLWSSLALGQRAPDGAIATPHPLPTQEVAASRAPVWRFLLNSLTVLRLNPLGLETQLRAGFQRRLYAHEGAAFKDNFAFFGIHPKLNPAYVKIGPSFEIQPISIFNLRVAAEAISFFSTFGYLQSFSSPQEGYSDTHMKAQQEAGRNYRASGVHVMIEPFFQMKVGPVALRNKFSAEYWRMETRAADSLLPLRTDSTFYDATLDTLVPANGWILANDLDLIFVRPMKTGQLALGVRYTAVRPLYEASDFHEGESTDASANTHHRVGPLVAWTLFDDGYTGFNRPSLLLLANWYVKHRFRTGADVSRAMPYIVLGFAFQSDFWR